MVGRRCGSHVSKTDLVPKRDETSMAVADAARQLFAKWAPQGKAAGLIIVVNPINRLFWRRWKVVEGLDLRVGCRRNPPPEGLTLGGHRRHSLPPPGASAILG